MGTLHLKVSKLSVEKERLFLSCIPTYLPLQCTAVTEYLPLAVNIFLFRPLHCTFCAANLFLLIITVFLLTQKNFITESTLNLLWKYVMEVALLQVHFWQVAFTLAFKSVWNVQRMLIIPVASFNVLRLHWLHVPLAVLISNSCKFFCLLAVTPNRYADRRSC